MSQQTRPPSSSPELLEDCPVLDRWLAETPDLPLRDALLDLRTACMGGAAQPMRAVRTFLRLRPRLRRHSYLTQHRLRRALEQRIEIEVSTPHRCWREPLSLDWDSLPRTLSQVRRDLFERGQDNWDEIRLRLVLKPTPPHAEDPL